MLRGGARAATACSGAAAPPRHRQRDRPRHGAVPRQPSGSARPLDDARARPRSPACAPCRVATRGAGAFRAGARGARATGRGWTYRAIRSRTAASRRSRPTSSALRAQAAGTGASGELLPWDRLYRWAEADSVCEGQECWSRLLIEPHGELVDDLADDDGHATRPKSPASTARMRCRDLARAHRAHITLGRSPPISATRGQRALLVRVGGEARAPARRARRRARRRAASSRWPSRATWQLCATRWRERRATRRVAASCCGIRNSATWSAACRSPRGTPTRRCATT